MFDSATVEDVELLDAWRRGDQGAGASLFDRYYPSVARFFRNKVSDAMQEDLIHETFLGLLNGLDRFRGKARFRTFLFSVAHRVLAEHLRRAYRRNARVDGNVDIELLTAASHGLGPVGNVVQRQEQRLVLEALRRIPLLHQVALELHYWEDLTAVEIGEALGIPLGTAKTRLRDGRIHLEEQIRQLGSSLESLQSTLDNLDQWARRVRALLPPPAVADVAPAQRAP
jgi:RNA polymerase sigma factor (sigma-70 family)